MSRKKKSGGSDLTGDEWLTTFSDTITLLLTFFVLLYSMSSVNATKFSQMASSLQSVLAGQGSNSILDFNGANGEVPVVGEAVKMGNAGGTVTSKAMYEDVASYINKNKMNGKVDVFKDKRGVLLILRDNVLFDIGKAEIKDESTNILDMLSGIFKKFPENSIIVEGHTDNVPISNYKYPSNWELSTSRAVNVLKYFVEVDKMEPNRFTAAGYGEYRPIVSNSSDSNRLRNRRVNIIIVDTVQQGKGEKK